MIFRKHRRRFVLAFLILVSLVVLPYLGSRIASPWRRVTVREDPSPTSGLPIRADGNLRVACYNIAHGRGLSESNWNTESPQQRRERLDAIARLLQQTDADVVALNEVDFQSSWSHGVNQAEYLATQAGYRYWSEVRNLDFRVGTYRWCFGNAVLSRYPIVKAEEVPFPSYRRWEDWLAGKKRGLLTHIQRGEETTVFVSAHLSHRSEQLRVASAQMLCQRSQQCEHPFLVAGDLNSTPSGFARSVATADGENAIDVFAASGRFSLRPTTMPDQTGMTFRADAPTHVIDWILAPPGSTYRSHEVIDSQLSDHRPVVAEIQLPGP